MPDLPHELERLTRAHSVPSASLCVLVDGRVEALATTGAARLSPYRQAAEEQPYDLASVTKALVGSSITASLLADGLLDLDAPAARWVPTVDPRVRVGHLLTHCSGLPPWRPLFEHTGAAWGTAEARAQVIARACATPVATAPGDRHAYSDLGFIALLAVLEAAGEARLDQLFAERILRPAAQHDLSWGWPEAAATELCPVRDRVVVGTVHDLNCAAMGGISTHAGLFGTALSTARLADAFRVAVAAPEYSDLPGTALRTLWCARGPGSHCGGWDRVTRGGYTSTGEFFPDDSVGHLGYTGTSVWVVPSRRTTVALLSNRVHPSDDKAGIRALRPAIHDAVAQHLGWDTHGA
ncbi:MAG: CubicO group peptidase (beta-lactamase class C family) [Myxococcota bacterium]